MRFVVYLGDLEIFTVCVGLIIQFPVIYYF